ncbi:MAG TPA: hypothetical protein VK988_15665 [Acidimicrobiales bacterium]|nr:hypothetical protein [Acidimicrobiales bacterium]
MLGGVMLVGGLGPASVADAAPVPVSSRGEPLHQECDSHYIEWAQVHDYGGGKVKMRLKPKNLGWSPGYTIAQNMWADYFECIGTRRWFDRLTVSQQESLRMQHHCHARIGFLGRPKSGSTFDYESWHPKRDGMVDALQNHCN